MTVRAKRGQWPDKYGNCCPRREITEVVYDGSGPWLVVSGYRVGAVLAPGERPWDCQWEQDARIDDGHAHDWETVLLGASDHDRVEEVVRCASCHAPRCGSSHDDDPCMKRRHHSDCHRYLSGRSDHLGGMASSCACGGAS